MKVTRMIAVLLLLARCASAAEWQWSVPMPPSAGRNRTGKPVRSRRITGSASMRGRRQSWQWSPC